MRLILLLTIASVSLVRSSTISLGEDFSLPSLANVESRMGNLWTNFKKSYDIVYDTSAEDTRRFNIFAKHVKRILQHNTDHDLGLHSYRLGINKFATLTNDEFGQQMKDYIRPPQIRVERSEFRRRHARAVPNATLPVSMDWRDRGVVTPVKDMGQCGCSWAFSATGALEGQHARATGKLVSLSEQQLVDCSTNWGNEGCVGGYANNAFKYVRDNQGIDDQVSYPYIAKPGNACKFRRKSVATTCDGFVNIPTGNETALQQALAFQGPIAVAIDASQPSFQLYRSGVYSDTQCSSSNVNYGVLVVGYGVDNDPVKGQQEYYIVKNGWSASWGDKGYIKIARNKNNMCGISTVASYPIVNDKA